MAYYVTNFVFCLLNRDSIIAMKYDNDNNAPSNSTVTKSSSRKSQKKKRLADLEEDNDWKNEDDDLIKL